MSKTIDDAWDALPPQEEIGEFTYDPTPEAAALRSLFGSHAFRQLGNAGIDNLSGRDIDVATAIQDHIARAYLFAIEAHRGKPNAPATSQGPMTIDREELRRLLAIATSPEGPGNPRFEEFAAARDAVLDELPDLLSALDAADRRIAELEAFREAVMLLPGSSAATRFADLQARLAVSTAATVADRQLIDRLRDGLREALAHWRYPPLTHEEKVHKDELWSLASP